MDDRKRREAKRHQQAILAPARRRIDVLWAILRSRVPLLENHKLAA